MIVSLPPLGHKVSNNLKPVIHLLKNEVSNSSCLKI